MQYDVIIIGGGPAACAAAVYAGRKQLRTALIAEEFGGQSAVSETIFNWIGTPEISGSDLASNLKKHAAVYAGDGKTSGDDTTEKFLTLFEGKRASAITKNENGFSVTISSATSSDDIIITGTSILIATGSRHRKLDVPGAAELDNKGIMYCATCDGPLFGGSPVAVIGGGNAAFEAALQLTQYCPSVTLLHRNDNFKADPITIEKVESDPKIAIVPHAIITEIQGDKLVSGVVYEHGGATHILPVAAVFVEIGQLPNTEFVNGLVALNAYGKVVVDPKTQRASVDGVWAAGDVTDGLYHQNNIAAGDAVKAIEDLYLWIKTRK